MTTHNVVHGRPRTAPITSIATVSRPTPVATKRMASTTNGNDASSMIKKICHAQPLVSAITLRQLARGASTAMAGNKMESRNHAHVSKTTNVNMKPTMKIIGAAPPRAASKDTKSGNISSTLVLASKISDQPKNF